MCAFFPFQITPQGAVENEDTSSRTPNNSSTSSPAQPNNSWRRTHSYEKLDFTDVMPPPPAVTSPTRVFKHSTSVVASEHNGSLLEEAGRMLDTPQKTQKKRPLSSMFPRSSLPSASGTTSGEGSVIVMMLTWHVTFNYIKAFGNVRTVRVCVTDQSCDSVTLSHCVTCL